MVHVLLIVSVIMAGVNIVLVAVSATRTVRLRNETSGIHTRILRRLQVYSRAAITVINLVGACLAAYSYFTGPRSPFTQARPYLTVAAIVGFAALVGKFALSAAIVPFLKAIPGAIAGIAVKAGWDKWQGRKPRGPEPRTRD